MAPRIRSIIVLLLTPPSYAFAQARTCSGQTEPLTIYVDDFTPDRRDRADSIITIAFERALSEFRIHTIATASTDCPSYRVIERRDQPRLKTARQTEARIISQNPTPDREYLQSLTQIGANVAVWGTIAVDSVAGVLDVSVEFVRVQNGEKYHGPSAIVDPAWLRPIYSEQLRELLRDGIVARVFPPERPGVWHLVPYTMDPKTRQRQSISATGIAIWEGEAEQLYVDPLDRNRQFVWDATARVSWSSDDTLIATVRNGYVESKGSRGTATITASAGGRTTTVRVTVSKKPASSSSAFWQGIPFAGGGQLRTERTLPAALFALAGGVCLYMAFKPVEGTRRGNYQSPTRDLYSMDYPVKDLSNLGIGLLSYAGVMLAGAVEAAISADRTLERGPASRNRAFMLTPIVFSSPNSPPSYGARISLQR